MGGGCWTPVADPLQTEEGRGCPRPSPRRRGSRTSERDSSEHWGREPRRGQAPGLLAPFSLSPVTSGGPAGLPSKLPGPAALRVALHWTSSISRPQAALRAPTSAPPPPSLGPWACDLASLGAASVSPPVKWGRTVPACRVVGGQGSGWAVLAPGPGHEARWCFRALPRGLPPRCPSHTLNIRPKPYMVAEEPGLPLISGGRSQGLWSGTASQPRAPGRGLSGCGDDTEAQPTCPAVPFSEGHVWGSFWAGPPLGLRGMFSGLRSYLLQLRPGQSPRATGLGGAGLPLHADGQSEAHRNWGLAGLLPTGPWPCPELGGRWT